MHVLESLWKLSSALEIWFILQNIWRRFIVNILNNMSTSIISPMFAIAYKVSSKSLGCFWSVWAIMPVNIYTLCDLGTTQLEALGAIHHSCEHAGTDWSDNLLPKFLTILMLRLLSSKARGCKDFWKPLKPVKLVFIPWVPICQGFSHFSGFLQHFILAKLATSSI